MPIAQSGGASNIASAQIVDGTIVDVDINAAAAIALSKVPNAAARGANADITSLAGLTTPLSEAQGGTGGTQRILESEIRQAVVNITAANILAMFATPVQVLPAPGVGKIIIIEEIIYRFTYGGTAFTAGGNLKIVEETSGNTVFGGVYPTTAMMQGIVNFLRVDVLGGGDVVLPTERTTNKALLLSNTIGAFATGNSTMTLYIKYRILTL